MTVPRRDGATYDHARDGVRLAAQHQRVWDAMADGCWYTPSDLEDITGDDWASIGARLRDFRKKRFGEHTVERRAAGGGVFEYRLRVRQACEQKELFSRPADASKVGTAPPQARTRRADAQSDLSVGQPRKAFP